MPQPFDYLGLMGGSQALQINPIVQNAVFGEQSRQQNDNALAQQAMQLEAAKRADAARVAKANQFANPNLATESPADYQQLMNTIALNDPAEAQAMVRQQQMSADLNETFKNPTGYNIGKFMIKWPEMAASLKPGWEMMHGAQREAATKTAADAYGYLNAGDAEGAAKVVQAHIDADKAAGLDTTEYEPMIALIKQDPAKAKVVAGMMLSVGMGSEKFADNYGKIGSEEREWRLQGPKEQKAAAEASTATTEAQYAPQKQAADIEKTRTEAQAAATNAAASILTAQTGAGRLALDQNALVTNTQLKLMELNQNGVKRDQNSTNLMNDSAASSVAGYQLADKADNLSQQFKQAGMSGGLAASGAEAMKRYWGGQDQYTGYRNEFTQFINSGILANAAAMKGALSDKDIAFLKAGFPPDNANPTYVAGWLEAFAKAKRAQAKADESKATWISANGNLGTAQQDIQVGSVIVPKGTTFAQFMMGQWKQDRKGQLPAGIDTLSKKY